MSTMAPLALVLAALATSPALAAKLDSSANHFLQRCRAVVDREIDQHFDIGICSGVMIALTNYARAPLKASRSNNPLQLLCVGWIDVHIVGMRIS